MAIELPVEVTVFQTSNPSVYEFHYRGTSMDPDQDGDDDYYVDADGNFYLKNFGGPVVLKFEMNTNNHIKDVEFVGDSGNNDNSEATWFINKRSGIACRDERITFKPDRSQTPKLEKYKRYKRNTADTYYQIATVDNKKKASDTNQYCYALNVTIPADSDGDGENDTRVQIKDDPEVDNGGGPPDKGPFLFLRWWHALIVAAIAIAGFLLGRATKRQ